MAKKTQEQRIEEAAKFVEEASAPIFEQHEAAGIIEHQNIEEADIVGTVPIPADADVTTGEAAENLSEAAQDFLDRQQEADEPQVAAATAEIVEAAAQSDAVDAWNKVADRLYELEHEKHQRPGLHASRLGRLLERLP